MEICYSLLFSRILTNEIQNYMSPVLSTSLLFSLVNTRARNPTHSSIFVSLVLSFYSALGTPLSVCLSACRLVCLISRQSVSYRINLLTCLTVHLYIIDICFRSKSFPLQLANSKFSVHLSTYLLSQFIPKTAC